ncbi:hypothetical protein CS8_093480 [Cupriavidus sp. 8B]
MIEKHTPHCRPHCGLSVIGTYADHKVWQDVYRPITAAGALYLKLMVTDAVPVVSFQELEP